MISQFGFLVVGSVYLLQGLFLVGLQYTNVIFASIMMNTIPIWTFLIAVMMRYKLLNHFMPYVPDFILFYACCYLEFLLVRRQ